MSLPPDRLSSGNGQFSDPERAAVYRVIFERRDVRRNFVRTPIADDVLGRILTAAHHAGSVGFMQPWDFVVIRQRATKRTVRSRHCETPPKTPIFRRSRIGSRPCSNRMHRR